MGADQVAGVPVTPVDVPVDVRATLAHAAVQHLARAVGVHVLHIKGPALDATLRHPDRRFSDADVLVRPAHVERMLAALEGHGWTRVIDFRNSSAFEHSTELTHEGWGNLDLHRLIPGLGLEPEEAFERLWRGRRVGTLAGRPCAVPDLADQALVLLLHAARSPGEVKGQRDITTAWSEASAEARESIRERVRVMSAEVAFSVVEGRLEDHRGQPGYALWRAASEGGTRIEEWRARFAAAPTWRDKAILAFHAALVNTQHLAAVRGRPVSRREVAVEFLARPARGLREELGRRRGRRGPGGRP